MLLTQWLDGLKSFCRSRSKRQHSRRLSRLGLTRCVDTNFPRHPEVLEDRTLLSVDAISVPDWIAAGPYETINGQTENIPSLNGINPVVGAVQSIAAHPTNPDILYIGTVNGGIWKTENATNAVPLWEPLTDQYPSLSISSIAFDPTDTFGRTLVASIGRTSSLSRTGGALTGLLKTSDGGRTWQQLGQIPLANVNIQAVVPLGSTIIIGANAFSGNAANAGIWRSTDGGQNWSQVFLRDLDGNGVPETTGAITDLVPDPGNPNRLYVAELPTINSTAPTAAAAMVIPGGVWRSDDAGTTWINVTDANLTAEINRAPINLGTGMNPSWAGTNNVEIAVHSNTTPTGTTNAVYAAVMFVGSIGAGNLPNSTTLNPNPGGGMFRSPNFGNGWVQMDTPQTNEGGTTVGLQPRSKPGGQGAVHFSIVADPNDASIVYVGGDRQAGPLPNSLLAQDSTGRLFRGDSRLATGSQWTSLTHSGTASNSAPHADSREMVFDASGDLVEADDGGIYRRTSPGDSSGDWVSLIGYGLQVTEFHDIAFDSNSRTIIGGAQDTGVHEQTFQGQLIWNDVATADGGDVAVDNQSRSANNESVRFHSTQNLGGFAWRVYDQSGNFVGLPVIDVFSTGGGPVWVQSPGHGLRNGDKVLISNNSFLDTFFPQPDIQSQETIYTVAGATADAFQLQELNGFARRVSGSGGEIEVRPGLQLSGPGTPLTSNPQFITPTEVNPVVGSWLVFGGGQVDWDGDGNLDAPAIYESFNRGSTVSQLTYDIDGDGIADPKPVLGNSLITTLAYGGWRNGAPVPGVLYAGIGSQVFVRDNLTNSLRPTLALPANAGNVRDIVMDPTSWGTVYVATTRTINLGGVAVNTSRVFQGTNVNLLFDGVDNDGKNGVDDPGEMQWRDITSRDLDGDGLTDFQLPDNNLHAIQIVKGPVADTVLVGGDNGVWRTQLINAGIWSEYGAGLPNAPVWDLDYDAATDVLIAGTLGRGAWGIPDVTDTVFANSVLEINGSDNGDFISLVADEDNPLLIHVLVVGETVENYTFQQSVFQEVRINGLGGSDNIIVGYANGKPYSGILKIDGGGDSGDLLALFGSEMRDDVILEGNAVSFSVGGIGPTFPYLNFHGVQDVQISSGDGPDQIMIDAVNNGITVEVYGQGDNDWIYVGGGDYFGKIKGEVTIHGESGSNRLFIRDQSDTSGITKGTNVRLGTTNYDTYTLKAGSFNKSERTATFFADKTEYAPTLNYSSIERVTLSASGVTADGDRPFGTTVINIESVSFGTALTVNAGDGNDEVNYTAASANVSVIIDGQRGNDRINVERTGVGSTVTVGGGRGDDIFHVGNNNFDSNIRGSVTVIGKASIFDLPENDQLFIDDIINVFGDGALNDYRFDTDPIDESIGRFFKFLNAKPFPKSQTLFFEYISSVELLANGNSNEIFVNGTIGQSTYTFRGNSGNDEITVNAVAADTIVVADGGNGIDTFRVNHIPDGYIQVIGGEPTTIGPESRGDRLFLDPMLPAGDRPDGIYINDPDDDSSGEIFLHDTMRKIIDFIGLEPVTMGGFASVTFVSAGSRDEIVIDSPDAETSRVSGTSDGVGFENLTIFDVPELILDLAQNDGADPFDRVLIQPDSLTALGLQKVTIRVGAGEADISILDSSVPVEVIRDQGSEHYFVVTNTNDAGPGSLRAAIQAVNVLTEVGAAFITFAIPETDPHFVDVDGHLEGGDVDPDVFVISPLTELPALTRGNTVINGQSQQNATGDTNPFGPEIVLNGTSAVGQANLDGLVSQYRFEGSAEDVVDDNEPSATSGIHFVNGQIGQGVTFEPGGYIDIPDSADLDQQIFTLSAWVRPDGPGPNDDEFGSVIIQKGIGPRDVSVGLWWSAQSQRFVFASGNVSSRILSADTFAPGRNYHVAGTYDGATFRLYVDGRLQGESARATTIHYDPTIPWTIGSTAPRFRAVNFARTWNGVIDEVGIYNRALTSAEIASLATRTNGLVLTSSNNLVHGLNIQQFSGDGVFISGHDNTLTGNSIGTTATGDGDLGNTGNGVEIVNSSGNLIGGPGDSHRNVISGNAGDGIRIEGGAALPSLVGSWKADGDAADSAGDNDGEIVGAGFTTGVRGGQALQFDGVDDYVHVPNAPELEPQNVTLSAWVNAAGPADTVDYFVAKGGHVTRAASYALYQINGSVYFYIFDGDFTYRSPGISADAIYDGKWHQLTGTYDGGNVRLYVDGNEVGDGTATTVAIQYGLASSNDLFIGSYIDAFNDGSYNFEGEIDEVALFNKALSPRQVVSLFASGSTEIGGNIIQGNFIGTTADGMSALGNGDDGIRIEDSSGNLVGGPADTNGNVISGNHGEGIKVIGELADDNLIHGNYIGLNANGTEAIGNRLSGIFIPGATNTHILDNVISGNLGFAGIAIYGGNPATGDATGTVIQGNSVGTNAVGDQAVPNLGEGISINDTVGSLIGGSTAEARNVISGNLGEGIEIFGSLSDANIVQGNFVGVNASGTDAIGNRLSGIFVPGPTNTQILDNVVSGNLGFAGIAIYGGNPTSGDTSGTVIQGNLVGTNAAGDAVLGNLGYGISIDGGTGRTIGGLTDAARNVISGNSLHGLYFFNGAMGDVVEGNNIGTTADGMSPLGNGGSGVYIDDSSNVLIGGTVEAARNVISGNSTGISIVGSLATENHIAGNYIGVGADGVTDLGNTYRGVFAGGHHFTLSGPSGNVIGGPSDGERNVISGNGINGYGVGNIFLQTLGTVVQGNYIGTDWTGTVQVAGDIRDGVGIWMQDDKDSLIADNIIAGNDIGIRIDGRWIPGGTENTRIQGNLIGTTVDGGSPLRNRFGIYIAGHVDSDGVTHPINNVLIGGTDAGAGNVVSGNISSGITAFGPGVQNLRIQGNSIGTSADGMAALGNGGAGVELKDLSGTTIGGTLNGARNVISGNTGSGISITAGGGHTIQGNFIGLSSDGSTTLSNFDGVLLTSTTGTLIGGVDLDAKNVISGNKRYGVGFGASSFTTIQGNWIGTDVSGNFAVGNGNSGVTLIGGDTDTLIGGHGPLAGNLISGNPTGIVVSGAGVTERTQIEGNLIGTTFDGQAALGNGVGIDILAAGGSNVRDTTIGGVSPGAGNIISGNATDGIRVEGNASDEAVVIQSNLIGTDFDGLRAIPNGIGVLIEDATGVLVRGNTEASRNVISGNTGSAILIIGGGGHTIQGNFIGTRANGMPKLGNGASGVLITDSTGNLIGGRSKKEGNTIAYNMGTGVAIIDDASIGNTIRGNSIHSNDGLGIDLGGDGVTPNDNGDLAAGIDPDEDTGPNTLQNFPEINSVQPGLETRVTGLLRSTPGASFVIDFYANTTADTSGYGEGQRWLSSTQGIVNVTANDEGVAHFKLSLPASTFSGEWITATATRLVDNDGDPATPLVLADTSEFSQAFQIKSGKGERGPNTFVLQIPSLAGGIPGEVVNLDVQLVSLASAELAGTEIDVESFLAAIQHPEPGGPTIGLPFKLSARASAVSPLLLMAAAQGQRLGHVELVGTSTIDGVPFEFARWSLEEARLGSFAELGAQQDQFTLLYDSLDYAFTPLNEMTGTPGTPIVGTWDVSASGGTVVQTSPNLSEPPSPVDTFHYYVNIPGIAGDATLENYAGWIEASSFEFGVGGPDFNSTTTARATTFNFVAQAGSASPLLLQSVAEGDIFTSPIEIVATRDSKTGPVEVANWNLDSGRVVAYQTVSGLLDGFSIAFDAVHYTAIDFRDDGTMGTVTVDWNLAETHTQFAITPIDLDQAAESLPSVETFLSIPGVEGPSQAKGYAGWIPIEEFRFGVERSPDAQSPSRLEASSFRLTTPTDFASPKLFELLVTGATLTEPVELALASPLKGQLSEFARWSLDGVKLGHFATASAALDSFTLGFESVQLQFLPDDGQNPIPSITGELSLENGDAVNDAPLDLPEEPTLADGVEFLVNIPGINGSSTLVGYSGWIPVNSFGFELGRSFAGDSQPTPHPFQFQAHSSDASPEILRRLTTGEMIKGVQLVAVRQKGGAKPTEFSRWTLSDVQIAGFATDSGLADAFSLTFASLEYAFYRQSAKTGALLPVSARWERSLQEAIFVTDELTPPVPEISDNFRVLVQIPGIEGPSQLVGYAGWIEVDLARFTAYRTRQGTLSNTYATAFQFLTDTGIASPQLLEAVMNGRVFSEAEPIRVATVRIDKAGAHEVATWSLSGATLTSYGTNSWQSDGFSIAFDELNFTWTPELVKGTPSPPITVAWNLESTETNRFEVGPPPLPESIVPADVTLLVHLPGVRGDSTRKGYADWIELDSFAFQFTRPSDSADPVASPLTFHTHASQASPQLLEAVAQGLLFPIVDLVAIRDNESLEFFHISLDQVYLTSLQTADSTSDRLALAFENLHFSYRPSENFGTASFDSQVGDVQVVEFLATATIAADTLSEVSAPSGSEMRTSQRDVSSETFILLVGDSTVVPNESANPEESFRLPISPPIEEPHLAILSPPDEPLDEIPEETMPEFMRLENEDEKSRDRLFADLEDDLFDQLLLATNS